MKLAALALLSLACFAQPRLRCSATLTLLSQAYFAPLACFTCSLSSADGAVCASSLRLQGCRRRAHAGVHLRAISESQMVCARTTSLRSKSNTLKGVCVYTSAATRVSRLISPLAHSGCSRSSVSGREALLSEVVGL